MRPISAAEPMISGAKVTQNLRQVADPPGQALMLPGILGGGL